jgi:3-oxoacyl-[acyl-carrier protein] reductase
MFDFTSKTVIITGASKGIGRASAIKFASLGATLVICGRDEEMLSLLESDIKHARNTAVVIKLVYDVTDGAQISEKINSLRKIVKNVDVLVNNAGILKDAIIPMISRSDINDVLTTNSISVLQHLQHVTRIMSKNGGGCVVNVASIIGRDGNVGQALYSMSKAAVIGLTKSAAKELASHNIRVNAVAPGVIDTNMIKKIPKDKLDLLVSQTPLKRLGTADEVADAIMFLASDMAKFITGQIVSVDGGLCL